LDGLCWAGQHLWMCLQNVARVYRWNPSTRVANLTLTAQSMGLTSFRDGLDGTDQSNLGTGHMIYVAARNNRVITVIDVGAAGNGPGNNGLMQLLGTITDPTYPGGPGISNNGGMAVLRTIGRSPFQNLYCANINATLLHVVDADPAAQGAIVGGWIYPDFGCSGLTGWSAVAGDFDSEARLVAVRPLRDYPLVVNVGTSEAAALANWHRRAGFIGAGSLLMVVCSAFLLAALTRQFKRLMQSEAALVEREATLAQKSRELETANIHIDGALNNIPQGVCMFDREARIVVVNERYIQMYGLSREVVKPGCSLRTLIYHRKDVGLFKGDPDQYCKDIIDTISQGKTSSLLIETTDGRSIYIVQQPMANGGWVVTHDDVTERRRAEEQMAFMARHDALTGLANRVLLLEKMEEALARLRRRGEVFTVFMFDLDLFKAVNDSLGHPVGDALLKAVAHRLRAGTRETDMVARLGGDEFALLQSVEGNQREGAIILANRLLEEISAPYEIDGHQIVIGTSIGIVLAPSDGTEADQLLKNADLALYRAKSEGRHGYRLFDPAMDAEARARRALQVDLRNAIARDEFELYYQTVFEARTGNVCGAEALVRWCHPQHGVIEPNQFIHLAEEVGLIAPLGEWILRKACTEAARWPSGIKLAVNLSPAQFRKCNLVDIVADALVTSGLPPDRLEVEITESLLLQKNAGNLSMLHELKSLGISIVLDDFGTGYSSFSYLRMFPFDKIKIDRSFVSELSVRADCAAIVCAVVGLGRGLNIVTTAEGVETAEQLALLRAAGVDQVQGFLFSRPCPATELALLGFHVRARNGKAA